MTISAFLTQMTQNNNYYVPTLTDGLMEGVGHIMYSSEIATFIEIWIDKFSYF